MSGINEWLVLQLMHIRHRIAGMYCKQLLLLFLLLVVSGFLQAQKFAGRTNALYLATGTPNVGVEYSLSKHWSLAGTVGYQPWKLGSTASLRHWLAQGELRYWPGGPFEGYFIGLHGLYSDYNIGGLSLWPKQQVYAGSFYGGGLSYGYHFPLGGRWGLELGLGVGYLHITYDNYSQCLECRERMGSQKQNYFGPTQAAVSLIYMFK